MKKLRHCYPMYRLQSEPKVGPLCFAATYVNLRHQIGRIVDRPTSTPFCSERISQLCFHQLLNTNWRHLAKFNNTVGFSFTKIKRGPPHRCKFPRSDVHDEQRVLSETILSSQLHGHPPYNGARFDSSLQQPTYPTTGLAMELSKKQSTNVQPKCTAISCIIWPHHSTTYVDAIYCYRRSSVVCRSVCHDCEPTKTVASIEMPLGLWTWVGV